MATHPPFPHCSAMSEGQHILTVWCRSCGHRAEMPEPEGYGPALKRRLRCSACGVIGRAETIVSWRMPEQIGRPGWCKRE